MRRSALVLLSGGVDSVSCAHLLRKQEFAVNGLFVDYGQAAAGPERRAATLSAERLGVPVHHAILSTGESFGTGEVVGRNAFFVFCALMLSRARFDVLALGVHAGSRYFDCSQPFIGAMEKLVAEHTDGRVTFCAPFASWTKADVYEYFRSTGLPNYITYSCEAGTEPPCGVCLSCRDRSLLEHVG